MKAVSRVARRLFSTAVVPAAVIPRVPDFPNRAPVNTFFSYTNDKPVDVTVIDFQTGQPINDFKQSLDPFVFNVEPRVELLHRIVKWQKVCATDGSWRTYGRSGSPYSVRKMRPQKKTGSSRMGGKSAPHLKTGAEAHPHWPTVLAYPIPQKVKVLAVRMALTLARLQGRLQIVKSLRFKNGSSLQRSLLPRVAPADTPFKKFSGVLLVDGESPNKNVPVSPRNPSVFPEKRRRASKQVGWVKAIPPVALNVQDLMKSELVIISTRALREIEAGLRKYKLQQSPWWYHGNKKASFSAAGTSLESAMAEATKSLNAKLLRSLQTHRSSSSASEANVRYLKRTIYNTKKNRSATSTSGENKPRLKKLQKKGKGKKKVLEGKKEQQTLTQGESEPEKVSGLCDF